MLPVEAAPRIVKVQALNEKPVRFKLRFSDGTTSEPHLYEELSALGRLLVNQLKLLKKKRRPTAKITRHDAAREKKKNYWNKAQRKRRGKAPLIDSVAIGSDSAQKKAKQAAERPLRPFGTAKAAELLQNTVDADWERELDHNKQETEAFHSFHATLEFASLCKNGVNWFRRLLWIRACVLSVLSSS